MCSIKKTSKTLPPHPPRHQYIRNAVMQFTVRQVIADTHRRHQTCTNLLWTPTKIYSITTRDTSITITNTTYITYSGILPSPCCNEYLPNTPLNSLPYGLSLCQFFFLWRKSPMRPKASSILRYLNHTKWRITVRMTPLDEWSARHRDLYLTTQNIHNRKTTMPPAGFEFAVPTGPRLTSLGHSDRLVSSVAWIIWCFRIIRLGSSKNMPIHVAERYLAGGSHPLQAFEFFSNTGSLSVFAFYTK